MHAIALGLGSDDGMNGVNQRADGGEFELQILGTDKPQEALHHFVEPPHLRRDDCDVIVDGGRLARRRCELLLQQLEVNDGRIQRVLDFVCNAG